MDPAREELAERAMARARSPLCNVFAYERDVSLQGAAFSDGTHAMPPDGTPHCPYPDTAQVLQEINALDLDAVLPAAPKS